MAKATQFLKIKRKSGEILQGESFDEEHLGEIDLTGWSWSLEDPRVEPAGQKAGTGDNAPSGTKSPGTKVKGQGESDVQSQPSVLSFQKSTDSATTRLLSAMNGGEIFPSALLTIEERFEESPNKFRMEIELKDAFVVNFVWRATAESSGMTFTEDWQLNYSEIRFKYDWRPPRDKNKPAPEGGVIEQFFDRPPDASDNSVKKTPLSASEKKDAARQQFDEFNKATQKRK